MKPSDRKLGMQQLISRRDVLHGFGAGTVATLTAGVVSPIWAIGPQINTPKTAGAPLLNTPYPPARQGMRGNHPGSFEVAHQLARSGRKDWGSIQQIDKDVYDLVVVGGGLSGLSAAHFYRKKRPDARILILDNHDDFGGHAKRNEFSVDGRDLISYGGSSYLVNPSDYSDVVKGLMADLAVDFKRFEETFDQQFYPRHQLAGGLHFNAKNWGIDRTVPFCKGFFGNPMMANSSLTLAESVEMMPISKAAKIEFLYLLTISEDQITHILPEDKQSYLSGISYRQFLVDDLAVSEPEIFRILQDLTVDNGLGIEAVDAYSALSYSRLPGWDAAGLPKKSEAKKSLAVHRFPDGNASIARLLVRRLIPEVAAGNTMDDIVTAIFDYTALDVPASAVRLRLNATVINVENRKTEDYSDVAINYVSKGKTYQVLGRSCVMACNNSMIPYICPTLPEAQKDALSDQVKQPIMFTRVALRRWSALKEIGVGSVLCPEAYYVGIQLGFPVNSENYQFSEGPDSPIVINLHRYPHVNNKGLNSKEQYRQARYELLATSFEEIERQTRNQLASLLKDTDFDPITDIKAITVNRWAHGYAYDLTSHRLFDRLYADVNDSRYSHVRARKLFGRIAIANADAGASAMLESAVEQGFRAITELL
jgi:spermidine dehydrogenase